MAARDQEGSGNNEIVADGNDNAAKEVHYIGVTKRKCGRYAAEIRDPSSKKRFWLGTWDTADEAAMEYDKAAKKLKGPNAKPNFPSPHNDPLPEINWHNQKYTTQSSRAAFDWSTAFKTASASGSTASVAALPFTHAAQKFNLRNKNNNKLRGRSAIAKNKKPWRQPYLNCGVGMQRVGNDSISIIRSTTRPELHLRIPCRNPNPNPRFNPSPSLNFVDDAADMQQPPVEMALFGRTLRPQIHTHKGHGLVGAAAGKNLLHATSKDDSSFSSRVVDTQPVPPEIKKVTQPSFDLDLPEMKKVAQQRSFDLNLPEEGLNLLEMNKVTQRSFDLNLPEEEDDGDIQLSASAPVMKNWFPWLFDLNFPAPPEEDD